MSTTKHREVAKLDRVPLPVEAARIGATGWQVTRTGARVVTKLAGRGSLQQKVIKEIPKTFADLGPTYVKFGQIIASSPGAFGEELSREFRSLLDRVPPADTDEIHKLFVEDLGDEPTKLFKTFDEKPFASASIAQVHYATLHSGEEVVVKIQRPGIRRRVAADLQILKRGAQLVELAKLGRRLSAQDVVADFADNLAEELDFRLEAQSMDAWVSHMHASPLGKNIRVPQVYWDLTSARVLTMERIQGIRIDDVAAIRKAGFDGTELVKALLFSLFEGGLRHGLFHGDLHAGNLYVDDDGKIVFFDFGIMGRIDPRTRWLLRELVYALLVKKDHAAAGKIVVLMGAVGTVKPEAEAAKDLEKFATPLTMQNLGDMSYAEIGKQLSTLADAYDVKLPRELVLIGKQFLYVERYMKLLAPRWQMMSDPQLTGYFANFMVEVSREYQDPAKKTRSTFDAGSHRHGEVRRPERSDRDLLRGHGRPEPSSGVAHHGPRRANAVVAHGFLREARRPGAARHPLRQSRRRPVEQADRPPQRRAAAAADGQLVFWQAQPGRLHARGPGRRRLRAAGPPRHRPRPHRRRIDGWHDRADLRGPVPRAHQDARADLHQQQPGIPAAARVQTTACVAAAARGLHPGSDRRQCSAGQQDHRQPGLPARRRINYGPTPSRATSARTTRRVSRGTSPRCWAAAACCATTARSARRRW